MSNFLKKINETKIEPGLLGDVMDMHANMPAEDRSSFEARAFRVFDLLNGLGYRGRERASLSIAIDFRLTALAHLIEARGGRGFIMPGREKGMDWVHTDLVRCAAQEPVIEDKTGQPAFDADCFERRLLAICETQGKA